MNEPSFMTILGLGPVLWMLGGYRWKWLRRFVWPVCILVYAGLVKEGEWLRAGLAGGTACLVNSLPYGERTSVFLRPIVFGSLALPGAILGWPVMLVAVPVVGLVLFLTERGSKRWNALTWKVWEGFAGFCQAASVVVGSLV